MRWQAWGHDEPTGCSWSDLSSLWAGPLCGQLLARAGADRRQGGEPSPSGRHPTRRPGLLRLDERRKALLRGRLRQHGDALRRLLGVADIVIEGSRRAALRRRKLDAENVPARPGRIWLRINGYRDQPDRPAFGDDAAVAGGLVNGEVGRCSLGDAIADPLSGLEAARAIGESLRRGGGEVIEVAMAQVAARYAALPRGARDRESHAASVTAGVGAGRRQRRGRAPGRREARRDMLIQRALTLDGAMVDIRIERPHRRGRRDPDVAARRGRARRGRRNRAARSARPPRASVLRGGRGDLASGRPTTGPRPRPNWPPRWPAPRPAKTAGSAPWAITTRSPDRWTATPWTPSPRRLRCAFSTAAECCGSSTRQGCNTSAWLITPTAGCAAAHSWAEALGRSETSLAELSQRLTRYGLTGITDATPDLAIADIVGLSQLHREGELAPARALSGPG